MINRYKIIIFLYIFGIIHLTAQEVEVQDRSKSNDLLVIKPDASIDLGEFTEGDIYMINMEDKTEKIIDKGELMGFVECRWINNNKILIFDNKSIKTITKEGNITDEFNFQSNQIVRGFTYDRQNQIAIYLLEHKDDNSDSVDVSLCSHDLNDHSTMRFLVKKLNIDPAETEEPFNKLYFISKDKVLINDGSSHFVMVNLMTKLTKDIDLEYLDKFNDSFIYDVSSQGIIYFNYTNLNKTKYKIMKYSFDTYKNDTILFMDKNYSIKTLVKLYCSINSKNIIIQLDKDIRIYDYKSFNKLDIESQYNKILSFDGDYLYYIKNKRLKALPLG